MWNQALGHEEEVTNADGTVTHRVFPPDPKAQQFIFERREGKFVTPAEERSISLLEKISEIAKAGMNDMAQEALNEPSDDREPDA